MKNQIHAVYYEKHKAVMTRVLKMCNIYLSNEIIHTEKDTDDTQNEAHRRRIKPKCATQKWNSSSFKKHKNAWVV